MVFGNLCHKYTTPAQFAMSVNEFKMILLRMQNYLLLKIKEKIEFSRVQGRCEEGRSGYPYLSWFKKQNYWATPPLSPCRKTVIRTKTKKKFG